MHLRARTHAVQVLCHLRRRRSCVNCAVGRLRTSTIKQKMLLNRRPRTLFKPIKSLLNEPVYANCVYNLFNTLFHFRVSLLNCSASSVNNSPIHVVTSLLPFGAEAQVSVQIDPIAPPGTSVLRSCQDWHDECVKSRLLKAGRDTISGRPGSAASGRALCIVQP